MAQRNTVLAHLLQSAADGHRPTPKQVDAALDELDDYVTDEQRRKVHDAVTEVASARASGSMNAWSDARRSAEELVRNLTGVLPAAARNAPDPADLARHVPHR